MPERSTSTNRRATHDHDRCHSRARSCTAVDPDPERIAGSNLDAFRRRFRPEAADSDELWQWSVDEPGPFWRAMWDAAGVIGDPGDASSPKPIASLTGDSSPTPC
ncbi:MAG: hypothetical protein R2710_11585 [Acidimicrobiales bacterium]